MDLIKKDMSPAPWKFHTHRDGYRNVVVDGHGCREVANVKIADGLLIAAAPALLQFVQTLVDRQDEVGNEAKRTLATMWG